ncbi:MAG: dCTP deaminase [Candidatus Bathyarchaeota archaeon]|nr:MAG: dCTP deaminase [Candidatus Bathyarchaeota archaeon]
MTVLSDKEILEYLERGELKITPFETSCLNPAGYDLRSSRHVGIKPKQYDLTATLERVELGLETVGTLHIRSSLAREGITGSFAVVDPGFRGQLTLNLHNNGEEKLTIHKGEPIVQIILYKLGDSAGKGYSGLYQNSKGIVSSRRHKLRE